MPKLPPLIFTSQLFIFQLFIFQPFILRLFIAQLIASLAFSLSAAAEPLGIDFKAMPIGTTLITETLGSRPVKLSEKYLGQEGQFFVTEVQKSSKGGDWQSSSKSFYDRQGRLVRRDREKGFEGYEPYSCFYMTGSCTHNYQYPNPIKDHKQTKNSRSYNNRLEGKTLWVSWRLANGESAEVPFELGPYQLRIANEYKNRLGQPSGYRFIELIEP